MYIGGGDPNTTNQTSSKAMKAFKRTFKLNKRFQRKALKAAKIQEVEENTSSASDFVDSLREQLEGFNKESTGKFAFGRRNKSDSDNETDDDGGSVSGYITSGEGDSDVIDFNSDESEIGFDGEISSGDSGDIVIGDSDSSENQAEENEEESGGNRRGNSIYHAYDLDIRQQKADDPFTKEWYDLETRYWASGSKRQKINDRYELPGVELSSLGSYETMDESVLTKGHQLEGLIVNES